MSARQVYKKPPYDGPVELLLIFRFPQKKRRPWFWDRDTKPDLDKLLRAVCDAGTGILWTEDSRIVDVSMRKEYASKSEYVGLDATVKFRERVPYVVTP